MLCSSCSSWKCFHHQFMFDSVVSCAAFDQDPIDHVVLWLELLGDFARLAVTIVVDSFVRHRTTAVVLGCMTAHARCTAAQRHACHFLSRLVTNWPPERSLQLQVKSSTASCFWDLSLRFPDTSFSRSLIWFLVLVFFIKSCIFRVIAHYRAQCTAPLALHDI